MDNQNDHQKPAKLSADSYNRVLSSVDERLGDLEERSWDAIQAVVYEAVELEQGVSQLTKEEISLLNAYVVRDLKSLYHYMKETGEGVKEWLKMDMTLIEGRLLNQLLSIADKTRVEQAVLEQKLQYHPGDYIAGEVAASGMLQCVNCHAMVCLIQTTEIEPCHHCEGLYFHRVTSRWPSESEEDGE